MPAFVFVIIISLVATVRSRTMSLSIPSRPASLHRVRASCLRIQPSCNRRVHAVMYLFVSQDTAFAEVPAVMRCDPGLFHESRSIDRPAHFSPQDNLNLPSAFWYSFKLLTTSSASLASTIIPSLLPEMKPDPTALRTHCIKPSQYPSTL